MESDGNISIITSDIISTNLKTSGLDFWVYYTTSDVDGNRNIVKPKIAGSEVEILLAGTN